MTNKEQQTIDSLLQVVKDLRTDNILYREHINKQIESIIENYKSKKLLFIIIKKIQHMQELF